MIGQVVHYRYEVLEKIGDGPLFAVYKSRDKVLNRLVALKVLDRRLAENKDFADAVVGGYQAVIGLDHPRIARVIEADCAGDQCFVACEYARGTTVKERIRRAGAIAVPLALDIIVSVLEALEYAHANGVCHGDMSPNDLIVSPDGEVKLTDFGLSHALRRFPEAAAPAAMRSACYQAPELAEETAPSPASDLYSVGAILYEMLTGTVPFSGSTPTAVVVKQLKEMPMAPRSINAGVPKSLSDVVMRAIDRSPEQRYQDASAMLADIRAIRDALRTGRVADLSGMSSTPRTAASAEPEKTAEAAEPVFKPPVLFLVLLFVIVVLASLGLTLYLSGQKGEIRVPPLLGKTWDEAVYEAEQLGIKPEDNGQAYSDTYEAGTICSVIPPAGAAVSRDDPVVKVKISRGPRRKAVPDLVGLPEAEAYAAADASGFTISKVTGEYSDKIPVNAVISQNPPAGVLKLPGTAISLVISLGPKPESAESESTEEPAQVSKRKFDVDVVVPRGGEGLQEVRIVVEDERGQLVAYQGYHEPGDAFTETVETYGDSARIIVYVGDRKVSDATY